MGVGQVGVTEVGGVHHDAVRGLDLGLNLHLPLVRHGLRAGQDGLQQALG